MDNTTQGNQKPVNQERTLKDLTPNVAALLCYVGGWISGIVFLILEQKNRFVRFHALQSIIIFGSLTVANIVLGQIPFIGSGFSAIIIIIGAIFWIIMMIKAYAGEYYKVIWAGNLAEKLANESTQTSGAQYTAPVPPASPNIGDVTPVPPVPPQPSSQNSYQSTSQASFQAASPNTQERASRQDHFRTKYYSFGSRAGRITGSAFGIAWSIAFIIFFNFFSRYIAYYTVDHTGGVDTWQVHTLVTNEFSLWLPIVTTTLVLAVIGHTLMIIFDKYWLRQIVEIVLDIFSLATIIVLLSIFPFDFSVIANATAAYWAWLGLKIFLILISVGIVIGVIVKFIKFVVSLAEGRY
jgi:uncharacterized membrane protein